MICFGSKLANNNINFKTSNVFHNISKTTKCFMASPKQHKILASSRILFTKVVFSRSLVNETNRA